MKTNKLHRVTGIVALVAVGFAAIPALLAAFSPTPIAGQNCSGYGYVAGYGYGYDCVRRSTGGGSSSSSSSNTGSTGGNSTGLILPELESAYDWAFDNSITTLEFDSSRPFDVLNRQELAKIMVNYVKNVNGGKVAAEGLTCDLTQYSDYSLLNEEMRGYVKQACEMGIMGRQNDRGGMIPAFRPFDPVTRAEFGAVLSRVMYGEAHNTEDVAGWYKGHLTALNNAGILTKIDMPYAQEIRSWVWIALQRTDK